MKIGQVAKKFNLTINALHYWELAGIIPPVNRDSSGNRDYDKEDLRWINFAKCLRLAGVSIKCLQKYIKLFSQGHQTKGQRKRLLQNQLDLIDDHIKYLKNCHNLLSWKIKHYDQIERNYHGKLSNCILITKRDK